MKNTLMLVLALGSLAYAETVTYNPFSSSEGWIMGRVQPKGSDLVIDTATQTISSSDSNWNKSYAIYTFESPLAITDDDCRLDFSFALTTQGDRNVCLTLTFIDTTGNALCMGMGSYGNSGNLGYGKTSTISWVPDPETQEPSPYNFYNLSGSGPGTTDDATGVNGVTSSGTILSQGANETQTITGSITMEAAGAMVSFGNDKTLNLGDTFTVDKIIVSYEGGSSTAYPTMSALKLVYTPEPATATLSLLALAGLAARRRRH